MPRRGNIAKRDVLQDPLYNSKLVTRLINNIMLDGKKGVAHTFFMQQNKGLAGELVNVLREAGQIVPDALLKFGTHVKKKESKLYGAHFKEIPVDAPKSQKKTFDDSDED